jgi:molybdate transport system permease protein
VTTAFDSEDLAVLRVTLEVACGALLVLAPVALLLGFALARASFRGKAVVETLVAVPLILPPTAIGYLLLALFARDGWLGPARLGFDPGVLFTRTGAVLAAALVALPLATRTARTAFEGVDPRLELMSRSLGHGRLATFRRVTLPLARHGLIAALALGFGRALGEFGATVIVAGSIPGATRTLSLAIFEDIQLGRTSHALLLVGVTLALAFVVMACVERLLSPDRARARQRGG